MPVHRAAAQAIGLPSSSRTVLPDPDDCPQCSESTANPVADICAECPELCSPCTAETCTDDQCIVVCGNACPSSGACQDSSCKLDHQYGASWADWPCLDETCSNRNIDACCETRQYDLQKASIEGDLLSANRRTPEYPWKVASPLNLFTHSNLPADPFADGHGQERSSLLESPYQPQSTYRFPSSPASTLFSPSLGSPSSSSSPLSRGEPTLAAPFPCQWGGCAHGFMSMPELISHVTAVHLPLTLGLSSQASFSGLPSASFKTPSLECMWGGCNTHERPFGDVSQMHNHRADSESSLSALSKHFLHDHLGVDPRDNASMSVFGRDVDTASPTAHSPMTTRGISEARSTTRASPTPTTTTEAETVHPCLWNGCTMQFSNSEELTVHLTAEHVGSGKNSYNCMWAGCSRSGDGKSFTSKQKILRHLQSHTGHRPFQCSECSQFFSEAATLQQHMRRHTHEKPFVCDFPGCGKAFAITGALTIHRRVHNGEKPFKCTYCDRSFAESSNLAKHLRTHTGARPYACPEEGCGKRFARPDQLSRHAGVHKRKAAKEPAINISHV